MTQHSSDEKGRAGQGFLCQDGLPDPQPQCCPVSSCLAAQWLSSAHITRLQARPRAVCSVGSARNTAELPCQKPSSTKPRMGERSQGDTGLRGHHSRQAVIPSAQRLSGHTWNPVVGFGPHCTKAWTGRVMATGTIQGQGSRHLGKG